MKYQSGYSVVTYTSEDGKTSEDVWNGRDGVILGIITLKNGKQGYPTALDFKGKGYSPKAGMPEFTETPPDPAERGSVLGWPGQPFLQR